MRWMSSGSETSNNGEAVGAIGHTGEIALDAHAPGPTQGRLGVEEDRIRRVGDVDHAQPDGADAEEGVVSAQGDARCRRSRS